MNKVVAIVVSIIAGCVILAGAGVASVMYVTNHSKPVAVAVEKPQSTKAPQHKKHHHRQHNAAPAPAAQAPAPVGQAPINSLREVEPGVYANQNTSDAFAENVVYSYEHPGINYVYSPVTGQTYAMTYTPQPNGTVIATGGNNAYVQF